MEATLEYLADDPKWEKEKPYKILFKTDSTIPQSNCRFETGKAHVQNVRQLARQHSIEIDGFELVQSPIQALHAADFEDPQKEESVVVPYLKATMEFVKNRLSAERIVCIDWRFRAQGREEKDFNSLDDLTNVRNEALQPARYAHTDYSLQGGWFRVKQHLSDDEMARYNNDTWRIRIVNVWRPLVPVVQNFPLAFCHPDTIDSSTDTVEKDNVTNANVAVGSLYLLHRPRHRWYYADQQTSDEVWMFKTWEGETDFRCPPHCSFEVPGAPADAPPRESVEARFIVMARRDETVDSDLIFQGEMPSPLRGLG